jgi:hypothetical protein
VLVQRVIKPIVSWVLRPFGREATDPVVAHFIAEQHRLKAEQEEIDRAMARNPSDPALLRRIEKLTAEAESLDRLALGRLNLGAAQAFGAPEFERQIRPLRRYAWRHGHRPMLAPLVRLGALLLVLTGSIYVVTRALTHGRHHPSPSRGAAEATFRTPGLSGYSSQEIVAMVEHKVTAEGIFDAAQESIVCPEGSYVAGAVLKCTLDSPHGHGAFDVLVTGDGIRIEMPGEAP